MKSLTGSELRKAYLEFFESKGHLRADSYSLIPKDDPSLLLIGAGMAPLKPYFTGKLTPPRRRMTTCQKCVRTGDIENVGRTARHHTFFEMLGNFSFGDYFKEEAITWAWEFLTQVLEMPQDRLWVTIYEDDDEAFAIWRDKIGVPAERIVRMKDNFWEIGTGPCGPCSEIYFDQGPEYGCGSPDCGVGCNCDRYLEIWNLVFSQFDRDEEGNYHPLAQKNIDTGAGLERVAAVLQGKPSNFETDLLYPIIAATEKLSGKKYEPRTKAEVSMRVIADHSRAVTFLVGDGVLPANEGRGYVLRRILRRAARHGKLLGIDRPFLHTLVGTVVDIMRDAYPELAEKQSYIERVVRIEEERFQETLDAGLNILQGMINDLQEQGKTELSGQDAFRLYDTYGFPLDLTQDILREQGLTVDEQGFRAAMEEQRERARKALQDVDAMGTGKEAYAALGDIKTLFTGYDRMTDEGEVLGIIKEGEIAGFAEAGDEVKIVLDRTPFYGESGGQVGDTGAMTAPGLRVEITDTEKTGDGKIIHHGKVMEGRLQTGIKVTAKVNEDRRRSIARNHSATHLLHKTLKEVLGEHANQAGSLVAPDRLRFDFTHFAPVSPKELAQIQQKVNEAILLNLPVMVQEMALAEAKQAGATALFDEKYGDTVRVVQIGEYSKELCGGTHVKSSGEIGLFEIVSEAGIGAGLRRIEALTGRAALEHFAELKEELSRTAVLLKSGLTEVPRKVEELTQRLKEKEREAESLRAKLSAIEAEKLLTRTETVNGVTLLAAKVDQPDMDGLRHMADLLRDKMGSAVVVLAATPGDKVNFVVTATKDLLAKGVHAGNLIKEVAKVAGGGGGGRPDMAQAGGKNPQAVDEALKKAKEVLAAQLGAK